MRSDVLTPPIAAQTIPGAPPRRAAPRRTLLGAAPALTLLLFLLPIVAGLAGTLLPAFGWLPAIGGHALSLAPWRELVREPGFAVSVTLSLQIGLLAALLSLAAAVGFCALLADRPWFRRSGALVSPLLAAPHVAVAIGFAFLIAPSGWLVRLVSPALTGWERPPIDLVTLRDPAGLAMVAGLMLKEVPYLVLMILAALRQVPQRQRVMSAAALGYGGASAWLKTVFPAVYAQLRLPVYAVLAFSLSNVEVGMILAPANPPPLALLAARWFSDYDLQRYFPAAAAAVLQLLLVVGALLAWRGGEWLVARLGRAWCARGQRRGLAEIATRIAGSGGVACLLLGAATLLAMGLWSLAEVWRYPAALPSAWSLSTWRAQAGQVGGTVWTTFSLAVGTAALALALSIACLENESRRGVGPGARALWLLYTPLLVPQIAFLFGFQVLLVQMRLDGMWLAVAWAQLVFVLPYVFLSLADPWRALDPRYARTAAALGVTPACVLWRVRLPLLLKPIAIAFAVGCAVSVAQYLPTLFAGAGRVATLTTEAVTLSAGGDRRVLGVYAVLQALMPLAIYLAAQWLPAFCHRHRKGMA